jgi:uncharacterized protein DUF3303
MLFMVIERFRHGPGPVGERFKTIGRMLPDSVTYLGSWIDARNARCFQIMDAPDLGSLEPWMAAWEDLVQFEIVPVQTSVEYWRSVNLDCV